MRLFVGRSLTSRQTEQNKAKINSFTPDTTLTAFPALMKQHEIPKPKRRVKYVLDKSGSTTTKKKRKLKRSPSKQNVRLKQKKITKITKQFLEKKPFLEKPFSKFVVKAVAPKTKG